MQRAGGNNSNLTEMNRSAIVRILQQQEICSRADIARQTGLTQAAITKIVAALMEMGFVREAGIIVGDDNRRSIGLTLNAGQHKVIGVKFARQLFAVGVFDISGKVYTQSETTYSMDSPHQEVLPLIKQQIHDAMQEYDDIVSIGFAIPGPYLREEGRIAMITQMVSWHDVDFTQEFREEEFHVPVFFEHDANAGSLAELLFGGHAQLPTSLAYFLVGDGVGAGIIERGNVIMGAQGTACEIGHISIDINGEQCECGNYGCLEMHCSARSILKRGQRLLPEFFLQSNMQSNDACKVIFEAARKGNPRANQIIQEIGKYIGFGCVTLINAYNPDIIVIGDIVSSGGDLLLPIIKDVVARRVIPELHSHVKIKTSELKIDPTLYGAAAVATNKVLQLPTKFSRIGAKHDDAM